MYPRLLKEKLNISEEWLILIVLTGVLRFGRRIEQQLWRHQNNDYLFWISRANWEGENKQK